MLILLSNGQVNNVHDIVSDGNNLFLATIGGLYQSTDSGASWTENDKGILSRQINGLSVLANGDLIAGTILDAITQQLSRLRPSC